MSELFHAVSMRPVPAMNEGGVEGLKAISSNYVDDFQSVTSSSTAGVVLVDEQRVIQSVVQ